MNARVKSLLGVAVAGLVACTTVAEAQQPSKLPRIGYLSALSPASVGAFTDAFQRGLKDLGYVEGKNILIEYRWAEGKSDRLGLLAAELARMKLDVVVTGGPSATRVAKQVMGTTPIVMGFDSDPVGSGFVASLGRPGGNITGLSSLAPEISAKQVDLLKQIIPPLSRVAILGDSKEPGNNQALRQAEAAARLVGVRVLHVDVRASTDLEDAFQSIGRERPDALIVLPSPVSQARRAEVAERVSKLRLPAMYSAPDYVMSGGLMTYSVQLEHLFRRAATYVDRILKGSKPADLPVELPHKFELVINLNAAKQIGLTIPVSVLSRADRVIQ
jgi:putative ABC transport system substrate-binding protein